MNWFTGGHERVMGIFRIVAMFGLVLFSFLAAFQNVQSISVQWNSNTPFNNPVDRWTKRIENISVNIPADVKVVGYIADWDIPGVPYDPIDQDAEYMLSQYVLAPLIIQPGMDHEWIIGNFTVPEFTNWLDENLSAYELTKLQYGIYLIHRNLP
jgi:hypothetical protein